MLHITNGDSAAGRLTRSGLGGDIVAWRDVLHDGHVPNDDDLDAFRTARAAFLASSQGSVRAEDVVTDFAARDGRLENIGAGDEVVLWFEPDLYDQLQLIQVLARFAKRPPGARPHLSIVPADCFLGGLNPERFPSLFSDRRNIGAIDLEQGRTAWTAFTSPTPDALADIVSAFDGSRAARNYSDDPDARLPHLAAALQRQLEEYPHADDGLSRSERQLCEALSSNECALGSLFQRAHSAVEAWAWLGDSTFAWYAQRLSECAAPLITFTDGTSVIPASRDRKDFWNRTVVLTTFGRDVLRGCADAIAENGIDRWIGGAHLTTAHHWRWNPRSNRIVSHPPTATVPF